MKDVVEAVLFLNRLPNIMNVSKVSVNNIAMERHRQLMHGSVIALVVFSVMVLLLFTHNKYLKKKVNIINKELKEQHDWLKTTLSSITDGVITMNKSGEVAFINETARSILGISEDKVEHLNVDSIFNIYNEENGESEILPINEVLKEGKTIELSPSTVLVLANNRIYNIEASLGPLKGNNESIIGMVLVFRDVTLKTDTQAKLNESYQELEALYEQIAAAEDEIRGQYRELKLSEQSLKLSEERFRLATAGCNDGIWDYDILSEELFYSDRFKEMIGGYKGGNTVHFSTCYGFLYEEDIPKFQKEMFAHLRGKNPFIKVECRIKTNYGELKWVSIRGQAIWDI